MTKITKFTSAKRKIWFYSEKDRKTGCRNWVGAINSSGYGAVRWQGKITLAHRLAYEAFTGTIPMGSVVHHTCANSKCVNIKHLQVLSQIENTAEMVERQYYIKRIADLEKQLDERTVLEQSTAEIGDTK